MGEPQVVIIGAGIAGLTAAYELSQHHCPVTVLEARERLGGRICSRRAANGSPIELGAEFIHGEHVATWQFIKAAHLTTHQVPERHWVQGHGRLEEDDSVGDQLERVTKLLDRLAADQSFDQFVRDNPKLSSAAQWLVHEYAEGFHAADARLLSAKSFAASERTQKGAGQFRINQGYGSLIDWLSSQLSARGVLFHRNTPIANVAWRPGAVTLRSPTRPEPFHGTHLIVTVPVSLLQCDSKGGLRFEPPLVDKRPALEGLEMGSVNKLVLRFATQFWPVANFGFIHCSDDWLPTWWTDERGLLLTGWAGGPKAKRHTPADPTQLQSKAMETLAKLFGLAQGQVLRALQEAHFHDWSSDPFALGAYSYVRVGATHAPQLLAAPVERTLFFAGEATADLGELGTVHGAIESGRRAARECLAAV